MLRKRLLLVFLATAAWAQLAPRKADEWVTTLEGPQRVATQKIDGVLSKLSLKPGMVVADIGTGGLAALLQARAQSPVPVKAIWSIYTLQPDAIFTTELPAGDWICSLV